MSPMEPTGIGVRLGTVAEKLCWAELPSGSVAATVTVTVPFATAATVRTLPDTDTEATTASELEAEYVNSSPSGSLK